MPVSPGGWIRFAVSVNRGGYAALHTACGRKDTKSFYRNNQEIKVEDEDFLTIAKANLLGRTFFVSDDANRFTSDSLYGPAYRFTF